MAAAFHCISEILCTCEYRGISSTRPLHHRHHASKLWIHVQKWRACLHHHLVPAAWCSSSSSCLHSHTHRRRQWQAPSTSQNAGCHDTTRPSWPAVISFRSALCHSDDHLCTTLFCYRATACNAIHGIAVAVLSVRLSDACIVTKLNDALRIFWYHTKRQSL